MDPHHKQIAIKTIAMISFLSMLVMESPGQRNSNERTRWFTEARYGMFIHWGVYSGAEGIWKGEKLRNDNDYAEWIYYRNRIAREEYTTLLKRFDWECIDPEQWVLLAKKAGMKFVTITAKHHDGFALWDSQVSAYDVAEFTHPKRDIIRELATACHKHGLKMGLYYSHWVDWEHPDGWDHSKEIYGISAEDYDRYWQEKVIPQMQELLTNYGEIGLIWFDMWIHHSQTCVTKDQLLQLKSLIRELQPDCLINSRLGLSIEEDSDIDFKTLGDNQPGSKKEEFPWQSPATVAHSWGYHAREQQWKSTTTLLHSLIGNASLNGNLMLNIGPRANGQVPYEIEKRLAEMGKWLQVNGESIYGSQAFDLAKDQHDWGKITCKQNPDGTTRLYLHLYNWPLNQRLTVSGIQGSPVNAWLLADPEQQTLPYSNKEVITRIELPPEQPDPLVPVVVLEYDHYPATEEGLVAESLYGGYSLTPSNATLLKGSKELQPPTRRGTIPVHIQVSEKSSYQWKIFIDHPLTLQTDLSYNYQGEEGNGEITVKSEAGLLSGTFRNTGRFVGEPNSNWQIDSFNSHRLGQLEFTEPGYYTITLEIKPGKKEEMGFQWLWLGPD
ncbi:MAG: alpha-L-fucosidase [Bacteroidales bacterium]|nr:alpha-L-fucosidase [Bacteroidales bacterium]